MIWLKRALPFVVAAALWFGWDYYTIEQSKAATAERDRVALVVAELWVGSAIYTADQARYQYFRDSLLEANGLVPDDLTAYLKGFEGAEEDMLPFSERVRTLVDSLSRIEEDTVEAE